jgi:hypothetical protein
MSITRYDLNISFSPVACFTVYCVVWLLNRNWELAVIVVQVLLTNKQTKELVSHIRGYVNMRKNNSVVLVRQRTIPIERSPTVSEASANFIG